MYIIPLLIFVILAIFSPWIDWYVAHAIYESHGGFYENRLVEALFYWGSWPAWLTAIVAVFALGSKKYRNPALLYLLTFGLGTGLLVNGILKEFWPRPRPAQVIDFGGDVPFHAFWQPLWGPGNFKSFPSGHAAVGFVFFALFWAGYQWKHKYMKIIGLAIAILWGTALSLMRIFTGGHFFFDTITSAAIMWYLPPLFLRLTALWKN